jgi:hypothetical protein
MDRIKIVVARLERFPYKSPMTKTEAAMNGLGSEREVVVSNVWGNTWKVTFINCGTYQSAARVAYTDGQPVKMGCDEWQEAVSLALRMP